MRALSVQPAVVGAGVGVGAAAVPDVGVLDPPPPHAARKATQPAVSAKRLTRAEKFKSAKTLPLQLSARYFAVRS